MCGCTYPPFLRPSPCLTALRLTPQACITIFSPPACTDSDGGPRVVALRAAGSSDSGCGIEVTVSFGGLAGVLTGSAAVRVVSLAALQLRASPGVAATPTAGGGGDEASGTEVLGETLRLLQCGWDNYESRCVLQLRVGGFLGVKGLHEVVHKMCLGRCSGCFSAAWKVAKVCAEDEQIPGC